MKFNRNHYATAAVAALIAGAGTTGWSGTLDDNVLIETSGDGLVFADPDEGVVEPGMQAITFTRTRIDDPDDPGEFLFVDPFEVIRTDFTDGTNPDDASGDWSRGSITNCLDASNPDVYCDSERGSGKRIKTWLTGRGALDMRLATAPSDLYPTVDYFTFGKTSNFTGARVTGFSIELLDANGNPMRDSAAANAVLYNLNATEVGLGARVVDGLFGAGGNEGDIGFFANTRAPLTPTFTTDVLDFGAFTNPTYIGLFGDALLDNTMVPEGLFWDDNDNPDDESALVAWNNTGNGGWTYGNIGLDDPLTPENELDLRVQELADTLGVAVADLQYAYGSLVPADIVAAAEASGLFGVDIIEDLRNVNLNFTMTVGNVDTGEFTLRIVPRFAPIVSETETDYQFRVAASLDAANVPYFGADPVYLGTVANALALGAAEQNQALERLGFSFLSAYPGLAFSTAQEQVFAVRAGAGPSQAGADVARDGAWFSLGDGARGLVSLSGATGDVARTTNGIGYDFQIANLSAGLEFPLEDGVSAGVLAGVAQADANIDDDRGTLDQQALSIAVFGRGQLGDGGSIEAIAGYQSLSFDSTRTIDAAGVSETALGSTDGSVLFAALSGDYMISRGGVSFGPTGAFEFYDVSVDGFSETGAGAYNIDVGDQDTSMVVARLGVRAEAEFSTGGGVVRPYGLLGWASRSSDDGLIPTSFGGVLPGLTPVDGSDNSWVDVGLGFTVEAGRSDSVTTSFGMDYRGAISDDYENHSARLFLEVSF